MTRVLASLTFRQLLGRRRTLLIGLVFALPILIAVVYRFSDRSPGDPTSAEFALGLEGGLVFTLLLPLVALVLGTAALGAEIEDGTAVFLLSKPVERWRIIVVKAVVSGVATTLLVVPATLLSAWIVHESFTADGLAIGMALGSGAAAVLYCTVFVALSAFTSRALIWGLVYVFVWEAIVTNLFGALRWVSIREYSFGWADAVISIEDTSVWDPELGATAAIIASVLAIVASLVLGTRALSNFEIGEVS